MCKGKTLLDVANKLLKTKSLLTSPSNVFSTKNLNFHWRWRWLDQIHLIYFNPPQKKQPELFSFWVATTPKKQRNNFSSFFVLFSIFCLFEFNSDLRFKDVTFWHFGISKTPFTWGNEPLHTCKSCQYFANLVWKKCIPSKWKVLPTSSTCYAWLHTGCIMFLSSLTFH